MKITSQVFEDGGMIPERFTCDGESINPPLDFSDIPLNCQSLALIVDDPDAPMGTFTHWLVWNINPESEQIEENSVPNGAVEGVNSSGNNDYHGPCPASGAHRYYFRLYALGTPIDLDETADRFELEAAMTDNIIETSELMGKYRRGE